MCALNDSKLLLVTGSPSTFNRLAQQLMGILPEKIDIVPYHVREKENVRLSGSYFIIFSSEEVYDTFSCSENFKHVGQYIIGQREIFNDRLDIILSLPRDQKILLVTDSKKTANDAVANLHDIGFDFFQFVPYYPGCGISGRDYTIAVTTGDIACVPKGIDKVYDIGARPFAFATIIKIMSHYGVLEEKIQSYAQNYLDRILAFARRLSNVANEAGKEMKAVRATLMGTGYYAKYKFDDIVGQSPAIEKIKSIAMKIAGTDLSVLIEGENGTGKELLASSIHNESERRNKPFIAINCSALPDQLIESELFGYEEGAFTGAKKGGKIGLFQQADGGTLFLDEIGDISLQMQTKLLRVLQEKEIMKIGGSKIIPVDVRIVAATNRNLRQLIDEGKFRNDLYYRIKEGYLYVPPLAERKQDIPLLIEHWMKHMFHSKKEIKPSVMTALMDRDWPGNIRELLNALKYILAVSESDVITEADIPDERGVRVPAKQQQYHRGSWDTDDISKLILAEIYKLNRRHEVAGRKKVFEAIQKKDVFMTEYKIRKSLGALKEAGLIQTVRGRYGLYLTDEALRMMENDQK